MLLLEDLHGDVRGQTVAGEHVSGAYEVLVGVMSATDCVDREVKGVRIDTAGPLFPTRLSEATRSGPWVWSRSHGSARLPGMGPEAC